jgi:3-oxoadipate enol-lactonase
VHATAVPRRVVLLHSAIGDSRQWTRQVDALRDRFDVVAPDLPGFGAEPMPAEPFSFVERVVPLLPASLVGNSFGGGVALRTALAQPGRVERLVLVGAGLPDWDWSPEIRDYWEAEAEAFERGDLDAVVELSLEFWVVPEHRDEFRPQLRRSTELQSAHEEPELLWPAPAPLDSLAVPTLVVVGERDKDDFRRIAEHLAATIPDARLEVVEDAGHVVGVDRPDALNRLLLEFLED